MGIRSLRWPFRTAVALVVALAVAAAAVIVWQFWGRDVLAQRRAAAESSAFTASCGFDPGFGGGPANASPGTVVGTITLPGSDGTWPLYSGTDDASLDGGVGWYTQTVAPGEIGNMALVGRRLASGGAFDGILNWNTGDTITIETCFGAYTYTIRVAPRDLTVQPSDTWVLDPVPGQPGAMPTKAWLTLIANQDISPTTDRAVGFAELTATTR